MRLRTTFDEVADLYERARPRYPAQVFDDLAALAQLPEAARIVEIGCGTGQATLALAERGYEITCVELGEQLAAADLRDEIDAGGFFRTVAARRYLWDITYTADEYISVLDTYSGHRALDETTRERLYERIRRRIDARSAATVRKTYLAMLNVAARRI